MKIKICGLTNFEDALAAVEAGADMLGFNFYPPSPRSISIEECVDVVAKIRHQNKDVIMVGDSFERDILPSKELGLDAYLLRTDYNLNKDSNYLFSLSEVPALLGFD